MKMLTTQEAADRLGISRQAVHTACKANKLFYQEEDYGGSRVRLLIPEYEVDGYKAKMNKVSKLARKKLPLDESLLRQVKAMAKGDLNFQIELAVFITDYKRRHPIPPQ